MDQKLGLSWLQEYYRLDRYSLKQFTFIGNSQKVEVTSTGVVMQTFRNGYRVENNPFEHLVFALKYDYLNLPLLSKIFEQLSEQAVIHYISKSPTGKYSRKIGFWYEFLKNTDLKINFDISGNYTDLLDSQVYITGKTIKNSKWRINNNLLGTQQFCPVIRRNTELEMLLRLDITAEMQQLKQNYSGELFNRATHYLYNKETKSSYEIEHENPSPKRVERFVGLLIKTGTIEESELYSEENLTQLQNDIVDSRFAVKGFRDFQNYVGQSLPNGAETIHYVCPPPQMVTDLMNGLKNMAMQSDGVPTMIRAGMIAFGFVFIHPFDDGNGRLHRFLIHDTLVRDKMIADGLIIPVSAHILNNIREYDSVLEDFSRPLMKLADYEREQDGGIILKNSSELSAYYRFPDLTKQIVFLGKTIKETIENDIPNELEFLQRYDDLKKDLQEIVDMPDRRINLLIQLIHQNKGVFPKRKRAQFTELTDSEIELMTNAYQTVFEN